MWGKGAALPKGPPLWAYVGAARGHNHDFPLLLLEDSTQRVPPIPKKDTKSPRAIFSSTYRPIPTQWTRKSTVPILQRSFFGANQFLECEVRWPRLEQFSSPFACSLTHFASWKASRVLFLALLWVTEFKSKYSFAKIYFFQFYSFYSYAYHQKLHY